MLLMQLRLQLAVIAAATLEGMGCWKACSNYAAGVEHHCCMRMFIFLPMIVEP
jgi:DNA-directed RNA polymerase subunit N (RpoN/RPB10)